MSKGWKKRMFRSDCPCTKDCPDRHVTEDGKPCRVDCTKHAEWWAKQEAKYEERRKLVEQNGIRTDGGDRIKRYGERQAQRRQRGGGA